MKNYNTKIEQLQENENSYQNSFTEAIKREVEIRENSKENKDNVLNGDNTLGKAIVEREEITFDDKKGFLRFKANENQNVNHNVLSYEHYKKEFDKNHTEYNVTQENVDRLWLEILKANKVRTISKEITTWNKETVMWLLNYNDFPYESTKRDKEYNHLNSGWFVPQGYYPINGQWQFIDKRGCFKPDKPRPDCKYENPLGREKCKGRIVEDEKTSRDIYTNVQERQYHGVKEKTKSGYKENALLDNSFIPEWPQEQIEKFREYHNIKEPIVGTIGLIDYVLSHKEIPITIAEGQSKKPLCLLRYLPYSFIIGVNGCEGILINENNDKRLNEAIQPFVIKNREIIICFDFDEKITSVAKVSKAIKKAGKFLTNIGCQVTIPTWTNELGKGIDDLLFNCGQEKTKEIIDNRISLKEYCERFKKSEKYGINLSNADFITNVRFLQDDKNTAFKKIFDNCLKKGIKMLGINSAMETGKTLYMAEFLSQAEIRNKYRVLGLTYREALQYSLSNKFNLIARNDIKNDMDAQSFYSKGGIIGLDSLTKNLKFRFEIDKWLKGKPFIIFWDEIKQGLKHLITSKTDIRKNRLEVIKNLILLIKNAEFIVVADAHLTLVEMAIMSFLLKIDVEDAEQINFLLSDKTDVGNFYKKLFEVGARENYQLLLNTFEIEKELNYQYHINHGQSEQGINEIIKLMEKGNKLAINCQSLKIAKAIKTKLTRLGYKTCKEILSKDTVNIKDYFTNNPIHSEHELENICSEIDFIVYTNILESGVSIENHPFNIVYSFFSGVTDIESSLQQMNRCRNIKTRYIHISSNPMRGQLIDRITSFKEMVSEVKSWKLAKHDKLKYLKSQGLLEDVENLLRLEDDLLSEDNKFFTLYYCLLKLNENQEKVNYYEQIIDILKDKVGEENIFYKQDIVKTEEEKEEEKEIKLFLREHKIEERITEIVKEQKADLSCVCKNEEISKKQIDELDKIKNHAYQVDIIRAGKVVLATGVDNKDENYPEVSNMVKEGLSPKLYLYYLMNYIEENQRDKVLAKKAKKEASENNYNKEMETDVNYLYSKLSILNHWKLRGLKNWLLEDNRILDKSNPESLKILTLILKDEECKKLLKKVGVTITELTTEIQLASRFLALFGLTLENKQQRSKENPSKRYRTYWVNKNSLVGLPIDIAHQILNNWFQRDLDVFESEKMIVTRKEEDCD